MNKYIEYENKEITKELLDSIKIGDLIRCNDWKRAMRVYGVSENYFVMARKAFENWIYSVCEKNPFKGIKYNSLIGGYFSIGADDLVFGFSHDHAYEFDSEEFVKDYLEAFEYGSCELSRRKSCALSRLAVKHEKP